MTAAVWNIVNTSTLTVLGIVVVILNIVVFRWLSKLQNKLDNLAERVAKLEGHQE